MVTTPAYPATRMRRTRMTAWSRDMHRETSLSPAHLIWPLFVTSGKGVREPVSAMPGVDRLSIDLLVQACREARALGIACVALFPNTPPDRRDERGSEALNPDNLMCQATRAIKDAVPELGVLTDVALDPYTSHGQDGLLSPAGEILNDASVEVLTGQALVQAHAGADIIAPSDMMDGRIGAVRAALEAASLPKVQIMSYAAKYASAFYGPFRDAVGSSGFLQGDKKTYQMDPGNSEEALREVALDIAEGADSVMVKPGMPYLDIISRIKTSLQIPVFAYQVSGEYAMLQAAMERGWLDREAGMMEALLAFRRAGCTGVLSYFAPHAARVLNG